MSIECKSQIRALFMEALRQVAPQDVSIATTSITIERPKQAAHGDYACNLAMQLAKALQRNPRELAEQLIAALPKNTLIEEAALAGPGFINLRMTDSARQQVVADILCQTSEYGQVPIDPTKRVMIEFVSANPTGPLHVGHGRQAALGDTLAGLFSTQGWQVWREFYYNDAGNQINNLVHSVIARVKGLTPADAAWPENGYRGDYIADIAARFLAQETVAGADTLEVQASGNTEDIDNIRQFSVACLRHEQDQDLRVFNVSFDRFYLESSLYAEGRVASTVSRLTANGETFEADGALWLKTTAYGDDKDRVMRKSDATYTYFVPDIAYHVTKWDRGYVKAINVQGTDHHGTVARVRAGLQGLRLNIPMGYPDYVLHSMVRVVRGGDEVKISKRAGSYVTLRDLVNWVGCDAVRFFLVSRKADSEFVFDIDLALQQNEENPVYYIQYAHARACALLRQGNVSLEALPSVDLSSLTQSAAVSLMSYLSDYPELLEQAVEELSPHLLPYYLKELAARFHSFYNVERILVDDLVLRSARLALVAATRQVIRNGFSLLGVSCPETM